MITLLENHSSDASFDSTTGTFIWLLAILVKSAFSKRRITGVLSLPCQIPMRHSMFNSTRALKVNCSAIFASLPVDIAQEPTSNNEPISPSISTRSQNAASFSRSSRTMVNPMTWLALIHRSLLETIAVVNSLVNHCFLIRPWQLFAKRMAVHEERTLYGNSFAPLVSPQSKLGIWVLFNFSDHD